MKKRFFVILFDIILLLMSVELAEAATKEDVITTLNRSYQVGEESFVLPDRIRIKMVNFIQNKDDLTPEQCDQLIYFANRAYEIAKNAGTTDINELQAEDIKEGIGLLVEASNTVEIDLEKELAEANITLPNVNDIDKRQSENDTNEDVNITETNETISEEEQVETVLQEEIALSSGEVVKPVITNDIKEDVITPKINKAITLLFVLVFVVFLVSILLLRIALKAKWKKWIKTICIVFFTLLIIGSIIALLLSIIYLKTIRLTLRLYYMFL